jgi:hypothetical protein
MVACLLFLVACAMLAAEIVVAGRPSPATLAFALATAGVALAWPLATRSPAKTPSAAPTCRDCRTPAWGFGEFGFCLRCGSTRLARPPA